MYEFKKAKSIVEELKIGDKTYEIEIKPLDIMMDYIKKQNELIKYEAEIKSIDKKTDPKKQLIATEKLGKAAIEFVKVFLGDEVTLALLDFYENNYISMYDEVLPYIQSIMPFVEEEIKAKRERDVAMYKMSQCANG